MDDPGAIQAIIRLIAEQFQHPVGLIVLLIIASTLAFRYGRSRRNEHERLLDRKVELAQQETKTVTAQRDLAQLSEDGLKVQLEKTAAALAGVNDKLQSVRDQQPSSSPLIQLARESAATTASYSGAIRHLIQRPDPTEREWSFVQINGPAGLPIFINQFYGEPRGVAPHQFTVPIGRVLFESVDEQRMITHRAEVHAVEGKIVFDELKPIPPEPLPDWSKVVMGSQTYHVPAQIWMKKSDPKP